MPYKTSRYIFLQILPSGEMWLKIQKTVFQGIFGNFSPKNYQIKS